jgi:hypothetical protein
MKCKAKTSKGKPCPHSAVIGGFCVPHWWKRRKSEKQQNFN